MQLVVTWIYLYRRDGTNDHRAQPLVRSSLRLGENGTKER